jgi:acetyl esterase/lipase
MSSDSASILRYGPEPSQYGELLLPKGAGPHPLAVVLHGGFWRAAHDLAHLRPLSAAITDRCGVATWNVEYRRVGEPGGGWPGTFEDVAAAVDAVGTFAHDHGIDPERVVLVGFSAGGHLALWAASRARARSSDLSERARRASGGVVGVVALAGISDLARGAELGLGRGDVELLLGGAPDAVPERCAAACPSRLLPCGVRAALVHGSADTDVPIEIARTYVERARAAGDPARLEVVSGADHFDLIDPESRAWPVIEAVIREIAEHATA